MYSFKILYLSIAPAFAFTIPERQPDGVYQVSSDVDGHDIHTFLRGPATSQELACFSQRNFEDADLDQKSHLSVRQSDHIDCGGYSLEPAGTDSAVAAHKAQCNTGAVGVGLDFYSIAGTTVAYFCNFGSAAQDFQVDEITDSYSRITGTCGLCYSGWRTIQNTALWVLIGYEDRNSKFCGRGTG
jgi:hypothetical protein